ncbi:hypothetical protein T07_12009 [Trichinella nelsoni]|uniref:Uncharacterized protein n=1 Tax=Trichinella nelsoni TaxID=6336 RepID=A0A0V0RLJ7_9BILA|nr:hypothetical protein T07_12009 [Trichinella nelsoni]
MNGYSACTHFAKYQPIALIWVSAIVMQINFVFTFGIPGGTLLYAKNFTSALFPTTSFSVTANECPALSVTAAAPFTQLSGASEARNLPLSCVGPFDNEAYQSAFPAPFAFLHLEFCEIVIFDRRRSTNTSVSILKHIGMIFLILLLTELILSQYIYFSNNVGVSIPVIPKVDDIAPWGQILINYFLLNVKCVFSIFFAHIHICGGGMTALLITVERLIVDVELINLAAVGPCDFVGCFYLSSLEISRRTEVTFN